MKHVYCELEKVFEHVTLELTTNGVLANEGVAKFLKEARTTNIQVSIDGLKPHHDKKRKDAKGNGTYDRIIANVKKLQSAGLYVIIRTHVDQEFMDNVNIQDWIESIKKDFDLTKPIWFYVAPVLTTGQGTMIADERFIGRMVSIYEAFIDNKIPLNFDSMFRPAASCSVARENSFSISCEGEIYKCWHDLTGNNFNGRSFGNIYDGITQAKLINYANSIDVLDNVECRACTYLPVCLGGCPEYVLAGYNKNPRPKGRGILRFLFQNQSNNDGCMLFVVLHNCL
ncbi:MAG: SPASM domain-containing protein [Oscillospiraceae bacterium]|nr:SPASM domain-containing protein [Oscillospiraceae bacterium]